MKLLCTTIVSIVSFCATSNSLGDLWAPTTTELNGQSSYGQFGWSVAIEGDTCIVGAQYANSNTGSAYVYTFDSSGTWNQVAQLNGQMDYHYFGTSVSIDGDTCVIGADGANFGNGSAYFYTTNAKGTWSQVAQFDGTDYSGFGGSVAIDGNTCLIVGGGVSIYTSDANGTWNLVDVLASGGSVAIDGDTCAIAGGDVYIYRSDANGTWNQVAQLNGLGGGSVAISGDACVVGAREANSYTGSATIYGSNIIEEPTGACCVSSGCFDGTDVQCTAVGGTWTEAGSCDDCVSPPETCASDVNADGVVDTTDLLLLIGAWGVCP